LLVVAKRFTVNYARKKTGKFNNIKLETGYRYWILSRVAPKIRKIVTPAFLAYTQQDLCKG